MKREDQKRREDREMHCLNRVSGTLAQGQWRLYNDSGAPENIFISCDKRNLFASPKEIEKAGPFSSVKGAPDFENFLHSEARVRTMRNAMSFPHSFLLLKWVSKSDARTFTFFFFNTCGPLIQVLSITEDKNDNRAHSTLARTIFERQFFLN